MLAEGAPEVAEGEEGAAPGTRCCDITLAISAIAVVRPAIGVTRFSQPENAGWEGGSSSDLEREYEREGERERDRERERKTGKKRGGETDRQRKLIQK